MSDLFPPLGEVAQFINGAAFKPEDWGENGHPIIRIQNLTDPAKPFNRTTRLVSSKLHVQPGDLLVSWSATLGIFVWDRLEVGLLNQHIFRVLPNESLIDKGFLRHSLKGALLAMQKHLHGATMQHVNRGEFLATPIFLPSLPEQRRIAAILDAAEALRTKRRAAIAQLDKLTQAIYVDMFGDPVTNPKGWPLSLFGSVGNLDRGVSKHRPRNAPELLGGPHPLVQTGEVANCDGYIRTHNGTYSDIGLRQSKMWPTGTLCITIAANIAKTGILTFDACFPDSVVGFRADHPSTVEYVRVWLSFLQKALEDSAPESAQKNINLAILRNLPLPLPPLLPQQTFAERIQAIEALKGKHRAALALDDTLFASLQHRAFSGEMTAKAAPKPQRRPFADLGELDASKGLEALVYASRRLPKKGHYWPLKAQYVADRRHLEHHGRTIYGEIHVAMPYGPVPQAAFNASRALAEGELLCEFPMDEVRAALRRDGEGLVALRDADPDVLSADERESLDWAIRLVADMSFEELKTQTHDAAWNKTPRNAPMAWKDIIESLAPTARQRLLEQFE